MARMTGSDCVVMYVWSSHIAEYTDQPGKVANPSRGQLNRDNEYWAMAKTEALSAFWPKTDVP